MRVLLITDTERLQLIFAALETKGLLELRTAATLTPSDLEISASAPDFTFVQSRISGFSSIIMLRHLKKVLPKKAKIILLTGDAEDAAQAKHDAMPFLDLAADDEALEEAIRQVLVEKTPANPKIRATGQATPAGKGAVAKTKKSAPLPAPVLEAQERKEESAEEPVAQEPPVAKAPTVAKEPPAREPVAIVRPADWTAAGEPTISSLGEEPAAQESPAASPAGFQELVFPTLGPGESPALPAPDVEKKSAEQEPVADLSGQEPEEPVVNEAQKRSIKSFEAVLGRASGKGVSVSDPRDVEDRVNLGQHSEAEPAEESGEASAAPEPEEETKPVHDDYFFGEPLAEAMLRAQKEKHPKWIVPVAVALVLIPLALYMATGKKKIAPGSLATPNSVTQFEPPIGGLPPDTTKAPTPLTGPAPTAAPVPGTAPAPTTAPAPPPALRPAPEIKQGAKPTVPPAAPESVAKPAAKRGLKTLPTFVAGAKPDPAYGKTHPGWQRFIGAKTEYKVFREADLYKAIQVIALGGETISDQLFARVLQEFGGIDGYQVQSSDKKGSYVLEEGVAKGGVAVTIYRKQSDLKVKGMVVYYR